jgi:hypothetical protein
LLNIDMDTTILRMRRQSQKHRQSPIPIAQYLPVFFSLQNRKYGVLTRASPLKSRRGALSTAGVGFSCATWALYQRVRRGTDMITK